jgi:hypothetical protein
MKIIMCEEIKSRLNSGTACYHLVPSVLSSRLLSRNVKVKVHKSIIPPVAKYGCETWSLTLTLREERRQGVSEQSSKENILTKEGISIMRMKKDTH